MDWQGWRFWLAGLRKKAMARGWLWLATAAVGGVALAVLLVLFMDN